VDSRCGRTNAPPQKPHVPLPVNLDVGFEKARSFVVRSAIIGAPPSAQAGITLRPPMRQPEKSCGAPFSAHREAVVPRPSQRV
jgi:hypothetical protein